MSSVKIDGDAIRTLREQQELTQLYLATVVGVTTDTISRWENRKYPSIKIENAQKLAEALEVELEQILEQQQDEPEARDEQDQASPAEAEKEVPQQNEVAGTNLKIKVGVAVAALFFLTLLLLYFFLKKDTPPVITAKRYLPQHTAPSLAFPVIVNLKADAPLDVPILLREEIEGHVVARPIDVDDSSFGKNPRWIGRLVSGEATFLYMVHPEPPGTIGDTFSFSGDCVSGKIKKTGATIQGRREIEIAHYHWADKDKDYRISDNEILDAYESFTSSGEIEFDFSRLEEYWLAGSYYWDEEKQMVFPVDEAL